MVNPNTAAYHICPMLHQWLFCNVAFIWTTIADSAFKTLSSLKHFIPLLVYPKDEKPAFVTVYCNLTRYPEICYEKI